MKKVVIYGAGIIGKDCFFEIEDAEVIAYIDNDKTKWGKSLNGIPIVGGIESVSLLVYDEIIIASALSYNDIKKQLISIGIKSEIIRKCNSAIIATGARQTFVKNISEMLKQVNKNMEYAVAEGGVFEGEFSKVINQYFPDKKLYLFDTFTGFSDRDIEKEVAFSNSQVGQYAYDNIEEIVHKMPHKQNVIIKKGFFPETVQGLEEEMFGFVNLDFDLYQPMYEGLKFFYSRLIDNGVILLHDYFSPTFSGVRQAVVDYEKFLGMELKKLPIGDGFSIAVLK